MELSVAVKKEVEFGETSVVENNRADIICKKLRGEAIQIEKIDTQSMTETCSRCSYGAIQVNHLKELDVFIVPSEQLVCKLCNQTFVTESELKRHTNEHDNEARKNAALLNNISIHLNCIRNAQQKRKFQRKFSCNDCDFESDHLWNYKRHIMKHGNELPFKCSSCNYGTSIKANLEMHVVRNHTKGKLHKCNLCPYENAVMGRMRDHKYLKHNVQTEDVTIRNKKFKCARCFYQSDYPGNLRRHENSCRFKPSTDS